MLPLLVGIGASAGGLDALRHFINGLPPQLPAAMVIAQHLSPTHTSLLTELLSRDTRFKIIEIEDGTPLQAACLYVTPPNCDVEVQGEVLRLLTPENPVGAKPSVNRLFSSMAISAQAKLRVGLVLSGTGSDGAKGLAELRRAGGVAVVQTLETCAYDGMPRAALESGAADLTLDPSQVGPWLERQLSEASAALTARAAEPLSQALLDFVRQAAGLDLSGYKPGTLQRRMSRRMALRGLTDPGDYLALIKSEPGELRAFVQDVFISVTEFFRDPPTIDRLRQELHSRLAQHRDLEPFRIWVPGCASGEEAYTLAIVVEECLRELGRALDYRIFCTDIAQRPLDIGRAGSYDVGTLAQLPPGLRERYFEAEADGRRYRIGRRVRDRLVFSVHDVTADAPFSRLDLVSCRNVLIYFSSGLQRQVLEHLHYALKPGGLLLLGASETITATTLGFSVVDDIHRLFRREGALGTRIPVSLVSTRRRPRQDEGGGKPAEPPEEVAPRLYRLVSERHTFASVVINEQDELMFSAGQAPLLFTARPGKATLNLVEMADDEVAPLLRSLIFRARRAVLDDPAAQLEGIMGTDHRWKAHASLFDSRRRGWMLLSFIRLSAPESAVSVTTDESAEYTEIRTELEANRSYLQQVIEDFEATTEQLQAANEELQSANEEFHSTNEELQTTIEELRSTNEELHTVNDELNDKTRALAQTSRDLVQTLGSLTATPLLVLDEQLRLRLFNPALDRLAAVAELSDGLRLAAIPWREELPGLRECVLGVIQQGINDQRPYQIDGASYLLNATPYRDEQSQVRGAVLVFADVTALSKTQALLAEQEAQLRITLGALREGVIRVDAHQQILYANPQALRWFEAPELRGQPLESLNVVFDGHTVNLAELAEPALRDLQTTDEPRPLRRVELPGGKGLLEITFASTPPDGAMLVLHEISERARHELELERLGYQDFLTNLPNRRGLERLIKILRGDNPDRKMPFCVAFMDLDQFKLVNDTSGHEAGDELLRRVASLIRSQLRDEDTLARIGGDEYALLLPGIRLDAAQRIVERLVRTVRQFEFVWEGQRHHVGLSCGLAEVSGGDTAATALMDAGAAASVAKKEGGNRVELASPDNQLLMEIRSDQRWLLRLRDTPEELHKLVPRFEPIQAPAAAASGEPGRITRWELLLRYQNDDGTLTLPGAFIEAAERHHFIHLVDLRALDLALAALAESPADITIHVNVSADSILRGEAYLTAMEQRLQAQPARARQLNFELTETALYREPERMKQFILRVSALGARVWLDDFGAGSSTLSNLRLLPVHGIKFDGALVRRILDDVVDELILQSLQNIARELKLLTVAEFAETPALVARLGELGVDFAQGWSIGHGITAEAMMAHWESAVPLH